MSCCVNVLVNAIELGNDVSEKAMEIVRRNIQNEYERKEFAEQLRSRVAEWMEDYYHGEVEYVKDYLPNVAPESDEFILGVERPNKIKEIVKNWNFRNSKNVIREIENFEKEVQKNGFTSLSDYLKSKINPASGCFSGIPYPASFYGLRKALDTADDMFTYDSPADLLFVEYEDKEGKEMGTYGVTLDGAARAAVLAHPERYALINICYD